MRSKLLGSLRSSFSHVMGFVASLDLPPISATHTSSWKIKLICCSSHVFLTLVGHT